MMRIPPILVLTAAIALAQAPDAAKPQASPAPQGAQTSAPIKSDSGSNPATAPQLPVDPAAQVPPNDPVITIHGLCPSGTATASGNSGGAGKSAACSTIVTKAQFEGIVNAINVNGQALPPSAIRNIAEGYAQYLTLADAAQKAGFDNDPNVHELLRIARLRTLAEAYRRSLEEKYRNPSAEVIGAYYNKNISKFEQVKIGRIYVPKFNPKIPKQGRQAFEKKAQQLANDVHERAAKGESLDSLQKEAYSTLGLANPPASADMGTKRRGTLQPALEQELYSLNPGEVTKLQPDSGGFVFYKLQSKEPLPLPQASAEIVREIFQKDLETAMKAMLEPMHTELNEQYFKPRPAGVPPVIPGPPPPRTPPQGAQPAPPMPPANAPGIAAPQPTPQKPVPPK